MTPADGQVITNEEAVIKAAREGIKNELPGLRPGGIRVEIKESEISRPLEIGLIEGFEQLGMNVVGNDNGAGQVQDVECDVLGFDFKYERGNSRGFLRRRMIRRTFTASLKLTISTTMDNSVSGTRDLAINYEDQISPEWTDLVKSRKIPALDPPLPSSGLKRVAEPVIVTAAVGALIYLFFANR